jgi:hypothetical protein
MMKAQNSHRKVRHFTVCNAIIETLDLLTNKSSTTPHQHEIETKKRRLIMGAREMNSGRLLSCEDIPGCDHAVEENLEENDKRQRIRTLSMVRKIKNKSSAGKARP